MNKPTAEDLSWRALTKPGRRRTNPDAPLGPSREQEIRDLPQLIRRHAWTAAEDAADAIRELTAELDRLRKSCRCNRPDDTTEGR